MNPSPFHWFYNCQAADQNRIPEVPIHQFRECILEAAASGKRIASFFVVPSYSDTQRLVAILADENTGKLAILSTFVFDRFASLTPDCPQVHLFEREIAEQGSILPEGHPWLKPVRFHPSWKPGRDVWSRNPQTAPEPSVMDFYRVEGEQIHEVAVGPVHAGIIEPGHFRFQCQGENVLHLEISLGYQHRGVERALIGGPNKRTIHYMQTLAGDTTIGHTTAYCQVVESLADLRVPPRAQTLRGIALELERLANHTGDLGALAADIGYLPTASFCGRIRGDFLNLTALLCGSRFGRNLVCPGGVQFDMTGQSFDKMAEHLIQLKKDVAVAADLLWNTPSVMARFEDTGRIDLHTCRQLGLVGVAARACGAESDCRFHFPTGLFRFAQIPVSTWHTGDVFARAYVRWVEIQRSIAFILDQIKACPQGPIRTDEKPLAPNRFAVCLVEGWRGEICHFARTGPDGKFTHYKITDPSFHNWAGLSMALRNQQISDFPLCNKSFNLSYCGCDL